MVDRYTNVRIVASDYDKFIHEPKDASAQKGIERDEFRKRQIQTRSHASFAMTEFGRTGTDTHRRTNQLKVALSPVGGNHPFG